VIVAIAQPVIHISSALITIVQLTIQFSGSIEAKEQRVIHFLGAIAHSVYQRGALIGFGKRCAGQQHLIKAMLFNSKRKYEIFVDIFLSADYL